METIEDLRTDIELERGRPAPPERKKHHKEWYAEDHSRRRLPLEYRVKKAKELRHRKKQALVDLLGGACSDCLGTFHICQYDFHHIDHTKKETLISFQWTWRRIREEAKACVLLCSNCHRLRHKDLEQHQ